MATREYAAVPGEERNEGDAGCCGCGIPKFLAICCCISCLVLMAFAVPIAIIVAQYKEVEVEAKSVLLRNVAVSTSNATLVADVGIHLVNPNSWPYEGSVEQLDVDLWSLDKAAGDEVGEAVYLGKATLPEEVSVKTESEVNFDVRSSIVIGASPSTATLLTRLNRDCGVLATPRETKLRAKITNAVVKLMDVNMDLRGVDIPIETIVPCDGSSATPSPDALTSPPPGFPTAMPSPAPSSSVPPPGPPPAPEPGSPTTMPSLT